MKKFCKIVIWVIIISLMLFVTLKVAKAYDETLNINASINPYNVSSSLEVTLAQNKELYISLLNEDSRINYYYPVVTQYENDSIKNINFSFSRKEVFAENENLTATFQISNNHNSNVVNYTFLLQITADSTIEINGSEFIEVINGDFYVNVSYNLLPKTKLLEHSIRGKSGDNLYISCPPGWLNCPSTQIFNSNNISEFEILCNIPEGANIGNYSYIVNFTTSNYTILENIFINIYEPPLLIKNYEFSEDCLKNVDGDLVVTYECFLEYEAYNIRRIYEYGDKVRETCNLTECTSENHTEYIMTGSITEETNNLLTSCVDDRDTYRDEANTCSTKRSELQSQINTLQDAILNNETECLSSVFETGVRLKTEADEKIENARMYRKNTFYLVIISLIIILIISGIIYYLKLIKKEERYSW